MARSTNLVVPQDVDFWGTRVLQERLDVFNEQSGGTILLESAPGELATRGGDYKYPVKFARPSDLDIHADEADPGTATSAASLVQAMGAVVNQSRRGYANYTRDEVMRGVASPADYSRAVGTLFAEERLLAIRNAVVGAGVAAIDSMDTPSADYHINDESTGKVTSTAKVTVTFRGLNRLLGKMRDARENIRAFLMCGAALTDLLDDGLNATSMGAVLPGFLVLPNVPQLAGRTIMVADISSLYSAVTSSYYDTVNVLGLAPGALRVRIVSQDETIVQPVLTTKIMSWNVRQDYDVQYGVQGMKFIKNSIDGSAIINPTDAELATASSWDEFLSDHRECGLVKGIWNTENL